MTLSAFGNHPLVVTPMHEDGTIDEESLRRILDHVVEHGAHGVLALGSTGEGFALSLEERRRVIRVTVEQVAGRIPVGVGVADTGSVLVADLARFAEEVGADYLLVPPPFYAPAAVNSEEGIVAFFRDIAARSRLPIMLYDGGSGIEIPLTSMQRLAGETDTVRLVKLNMYAPGKVAPIQDLGMKAFCGTDLTMLLTMCYGADGFTTAIAGVMPAECSRLFEHARHGEWEKARDIHYDKLLPVINVALGGLPQYIPCFKHLLHRMGLIASPRVRHPLVPIDDVRARELEAAGCRVGLLQSRAGRRPPARARAAWPGDGRT